MDVVFKMKVMVDIYRRFSKLDLQYDFFVFYI